MLRPQLTDRSAQVLELRRRLGFVNMLLQEKRSHWVAMTARLDAMSPLKVLGRGYAIALHSPTGKALTSAEGVAVGDEVKVRLAKGSITTQITELANEAPA